MELSTLERTTLLRPPDDVFALTEYSLNWREPLPRARFGNGRFMWGCVALAAAFMIWMSATPGK